MLHDFSFAAATRPPGEAWAPNVRPSPALAEIALPAGASAFDDPGLSAAWRRGGVRRVAVCGGGTEHGVAATAGAALAAGYETWLLVDACFPERRDAAARAALELRARGVLLATHDRFLVLNGSHRVPTALALVEPLRRWLPKESGADAPWLALLAQLAAGLPALPAARR